MTFIWQTYLGCTVFKVARKIFNCYNPFETMKDYKKLFLTMYAKYKYLSTSSIGQYFRAECDVIAVTIATLKVHKKNLQWSVFADYLKN